MHPTDTAMDCDRRTKRVVIDSRDRDAAVFPRPDEYEITLDDEFYDVVSLRLVAADVPFSAYLVSERNRAIPLTVGEGGQEVVALLEIGDYAAPEDLAFAVHRALTAAAAPFGGVTIQCQYSPRRDAYSFQTSPPTRFSLPFGGHRGTAARLLGFAPRLSYDSDGDGRLEAPFRRDFESGARYVVLGVSPPSAELIASQNNATNRSFAVIPLRQTAAFGGGLNVGGGLTDAQIVKTWDPPIARMARLGIRFTDYDGNPYDFQNREHRLEFMVETLRHTRKYSVM